MKRLPPLPALHTFLITAQCCNFTRAAELLHIKPTTLNEMIKRYEIRPRRKRTPNGNGAEPAAADVSVQGPQLPAPSLPGSIAPTPVFEEK